MGNGEWGIMNYKLHITNYKLDEGVCVEGHRLVQKAL